MVPVRSISQHEHMAGLSDALDAAMNGQESMAARSPGRAAAVTSGVRSRCDHAAVPLACPQEGADAAPTGSSSGWMAGKATHAARRHFQEAASLVQAMLQDNLVSGCLVGLTAVLLLGLLFAV